MLKWLTADYLAQHPNYLLIYDARSVGNSPQPPDYIANPGFYYSKNTFGFRTIKKELSDCDIPVANGAENYSINYYAPDEYRFTFMQYYNYLLNHIILRNIKLNREIVYLIAPVGRGRHNYFKIFENVIFPNFFKLLQYRQVKWLNFWQCDCFDAEQFSITTPWMQCWDKDEDAKGQQIAQNDINEEVWKNPEDVLIHRHLKKRSLFPNRYPEYK